jgi:hypothetical protein
MKFILSENLKIAAFSEIRPNYLSVSVFLYNFDANLVVMMNYNINY